MTCAAGASGNELCVNAGTTAKKNSKRLESFMPTLILRVELTKCYFHLHPGIRNEPILVV